MKKRLLSMLLVLCMTASLLPTLAFAADEGATAPVDQTAPADPPANKGPEGPANTTVAAAKIGDTEYDTLADAVEAAKAGDTIKIANDTTDTEPVIIDKKITLDLNGKKYGRTNEGNKFIKIAAGGELIFTDSVGEGMLSATKDYANGTCDSGLIQVSGGGSFVMESGYIYAVREDAENKGQYGVTVVEQDASFTMNGGKIEAGWYAVSGNGNAGNGGTTITVNGGELISTADYGIYHPQVGTLKIQGGVVYGAAGGIAMNRGTLFVNDGTITSKGVGSTGNWGDGTGGLSNAAIYLNAKYADVAATIDGGVILSEGDAVDVKAGKEHQVTLSVKSGTFSDMSWVPYAADGATVKLGADVEVNKTILIDKAVTLDLNGKTITSTVAVDAGNTILVDGGKLTITDSTDKVGGIKDEVFATNEKNETIGHQTMKVKHGELRLEKGVYNVPIGCSVTGAETDNASYASAPYSYLYVGPDVTMNVNYWYAVLVGYANATTKTSFGSKVDFHGTTTGCLYINGSVQATEGNVPVINVYPDAVIHTGEDNSAVYAAGYGVYNIEGGSLSGADAAIAIKAGKLNIKGGTLTCTGADSAPTVGWSNGVNASGAALQIESNKSYSNGGIEINITGGTLTSQNAMTIYEYLAEGTTDSHLKSLVITDDAKFISGGKRTNFLLSSDDVKAVFDITGGYFSKDPTGYEKDGYIAVASDNLFHVVKKADKAADIIPGPADVKAETTGKTPEEAAAIQSVVDALNSTPPAAAGLNGAAGEVAQKTDNTVTEDALKKAQDAIGSSTTAESLNIVVEPYVEVAVTGVTEEEGKKVLSLNIEAKYNVVATTAADGTPLVKPVDGATGVNAVNLSEGNPMTVNTPVEITVAVPAGTFANDTNLYVKHTKSGNKVYYYKATLASDKVTFTTEHGFSPFAISEDARTAAVKFIKEDKSESTVTYGPADVASAFPTDTKSGYSFDGWKFTGVEGATGTYKTLTDDLLTKLSEANANTSPIEAKPVFSSSSWDDFGSGSTGTSYTITASAGEGGTISPNGKVSVSSGSDKTFTIAASTGYGIADVKVDGVSVGAVKTYTFEDVKKAHTIEASFKKLDAEGTFSDVNTGDWFYDAVQYAYSHELMNGVGGGKFDPNGTTTRGMIVTILYRLEEEPAAQAASFTDVAADAYYAKAVAWAAEKGIVKGYSAAQFAPNDAITREQMASILYRYAQSKNYDVTGTAKLDGYTDAASISDYALTAMQWANAEKLIQGVTDTTIVPQGNATRAQVATILMRFIENVAK